MPTPNLGLIQPPINPTFDLWGASMNNNLALIDAASITLRGVSVAATAPTSGQVLKFNGTSWAPAAESGTVVDASATVKGLTKLSVTPAVPTNPIAAGDNDPRLSDGRQPVGAASGDLSGVFPGPTVAKVNGVTVSGTPASGQALIATSGSAASWQAIPSVVQPDSSTTVKGLTKLSVAPVLAASPIAVGDNDARMNDARTPTAHGLTSASHTPGTLAALNALLDVAAVATTDSRLSDSRTPTAHSLTGSAHSAGTLAALNALLDVAVVATTDSRLSDPRPPNGLAGGDLGGSFPGPTVAKLQTTPVSATAPLGGQVMQYNGSAWTPTSIATGNIGGAGVAGQISFFTGGTTIGSDINIARDPANKSLLIGGFPSILPGPIPAVEVTNSGGPALLVTTVFNSGGGDGGIVSLRAGGTQASPAATPLGAKLGQILAVGHTGTSFDLGAPGCEIHFTSTEVWTPSAHGTAYRLKLCPTGSASSGTVIYAIGDSGGRVGFGGNVAPGHAVDISGDANVSGVYRVGGTQIASANLSDSANIFKANGSVVVTGNVNAGGFKIANLASPTSTTDAAHKGYVDSVAQGLSIKQSVHALSDVNIALIGTPIIDGYATVVGDRVLATAQTSPINNGIYIVAAGAWARSADMATGSSAAGAFTFIEAGTVYAQTGWVCNDPPASGIVGTNNLGFTQFSQAGVITAGTGLTKVGTVISLVAPVSISNGGTGQSTASAALTALGGVGGGGTIGKIARFTGGATLGDSLITQSGTIIQIAELDVASYVNFPNAGNSGAYSIRFNGGNANGAGIYFTAAPQAIHFDVGNNQVFTVGISGASVGGFLDVSGPYRQGGVQVSSAILSNDSALIKTSTALGGDLSGALPNPVVAKVNGVAVTVTPASGQFLTADSASAASWKNPAASGDLSGTLPSPTVAKIRGTTVSAVAPVTAGQTLRYDGTSQWIAAQLASTDLSNGSSIILTSTALGGDLSGNLPSATVAKLNGIAAPGLAPTANQAIFASSASALTYGTLPVAGGGTGAVTLTGLLRGTGTTAITGGAAVALGSEVSGTLTVANGGTGAASLAGNGALVMNSGGTAVTSVAPGTSGNVLTSNGTTWVSQVAGGGGYSAAVVVAAPTGVAATDTANINNAIASISSGVVLLRDGLYLINASLTVKARITIRGQGRGEFGGGAATTIKCDAAMGDIPVFNDSTGIIEFGLENISFDFNQANRASRTSSYDIRLIGTRSRMYRIHCANTSANSAVFVQPNNITEQDSASIEDCFFVQGKVTSGSPFQIQGKVRGCTFIGNTATLGFQSGLVSFGVTSEVADCVFRTSVDYTTGVAGAIVMLATNVANSRSGTSITACCFIQESGTGTRAIHVENTGAGSITITGNYSGTGTSVGSINVRNGGGTGIVNIVGNAGFSAYNNFGNGSTVANDASTFNAVSVSTTAPTTGQVLTATSATAANWQTPTGGGVAYVTTVVVASPSGSAATDTTNVTAALTTAASTGGIVLLREGTYQINSALTIGTNVAIVGQGKSVSILQATTSVGAVSFIALTNSRGGLRNLTVDFNVNIRGAVAAADVNITGASVTIDTVSFINNASSNLARMFSIAPAGGVQSAETKFLNCEITYGNGAAQNELARVSFATFQSCVFTINSTAGAGTLFEDQVASAALTINDCTFLINTPSALAAIVLWGPTATSGILKFTNNKVTIVAGSVTNTVNVNSATTIANVVGNAASATTAGGILGSAKTMVVGNSGFSAYTGGIQSGNDLGTINAVIVSATAPSAGQVLTATSATAANWATAAGGSPTGAASGDLSGSYPGPAVAKLGTTGVSVTVNTAAPPSTGQVLTATSAIAATWQTPAGGGGGYAATVVVGAATGVAATDTANVAGAITTANTAGGGTVLLREGIYVINATLVMKSNVTLKGQGRNATTLKADLALGANPIINDGLVAITRTVIRDLTIDMNFAVRGAVASRDILYLSTSTKNRMESILYTNNTGYAAAADVAIAFNGDQNVIINSEFIINGASPFALLEPSDSVGSMISNCVFTNSVVGMNSIIYSDAGGLITNCAFTSSTSLTNFIVFNAGVATAHGNKFTQSAGTTVNAINFAQAAMRASAVGNVATSTSIGKINTAAVTTAIAGNAGFSAYTGGTQAGNV